MRSRITLIITAIAVMALALPAAAANPHYVVGPNFVVSDTAVTASGSVAGLGNQDISVTLAVEGVVETECTNPGGNVAPGQDAQFATSSTQTGIEVKNGRATFEISTAFPGADLDLSGVCPNRRWTPSVTSATVTSATLTVSQGGVVVLSNSL